MRVSRKHICTEKDAGTESTMRNLANAQYWSDPAGGNTGHLFLAFGKPVYADRLTNCPLGKMSIRNKKVTVLHFIIEAIYS